MSNSFIDITPGTMAQVHTALASGQLIMVENDVQGVANALREIDKSLSLFYDGNQDIWIVQQMVGDEEKLVTSAVELDHRLVARVRQVCGRGYDLVAEIEAAEREADREADRLRMERLGPAAEKLAWGLRKDLQLKGRAFVKGRRDG